jgi:WD40 repeat protein
MADVFISYAREDLEFVRALHQALREGERELWVDWEGIPPSAEWLREIYSAIEAAPSFIFVMSADSLASRVCRLELEHAVLHNKRVIPVVRRDPEKELDKSVSIPEALGRINWIFCRETAEFATAVRQVIESLDTDLEHVRAHARLTVRAVEWEAGGAEDGFLLRGRDLEEARRWMQQAESKKPQPSALQRKYIDASRRAAADIVAARALVGFPDDPELAILLAEATATELAQTPAASFALRMALAASPLRAVLQSHHGRVLGAEWAPDGNRLATIGQNGTARVWDVRKGAELSAFTKHVAPVTSLAWSPDGHWIVTGSEDRTARIWRSATGIERRVLSHGTVGEGIVSVGWSGDGRRVLTAPINGRTAIWSADDHEGSPVWLGDSRILVAARWNLPTDRVLLLTATAGAVAFDAVTGAALFGLRLPRPGVRDGVWSQDGSLIATCAGSRATIWSGTDGARVAELVGHTSDVTSLAFDPTGTWVATASTDRTVRIWNPRTGKEDKRLAGHQNSVLKVSWSPAGQRLLTVGADRSTRIWDAPRERQLVEFREGPSSSHGGGWSPDSTQVATFGGDHGCRVYAAYPGDWSLGFVAPGRKEIVTRDDEVLLARWIDDATQILTVWRSGAVELRDRNTGIVNNAWVAGERLTSALLSPDERRLLMIGESGIPRVRALVREATVVSLVRPGDTVEALHWAPDSTRILLVLANGRTVVCDAASGTFIAEAKPKRRPAPGVTPAAAWSPDGTRFLTCEEFAQTEDVLVRDAATGQVLAAIPAADLSQLWSARWSPDGRLIVIVAGAIRLVDPESGEVARVLSPAQEDFSPDVSFSPDGSRVLVGMPSGVVEVWDIARGGEPSLLRAHEARVHRGVWSADGTQIVTVSDDATARVWNARGGKLLLTLRGHDGPVRDAAWSRDERLILTRSSDHSARLWDATSGDAIVCIGGTEHPVERAEWHTRTHSVLVQTATGVWIWDIDLAAESLLAKARGRVSRRLSGDEKRIYGVPAGT